MLHIGAVTTNHAIKANIPNFWRHLSLAATCADIYQMGLFPCLANGNHRRLRYMIIIVDEGPIHIQKDDFSCHKISSSSYLLNAFY